MTSRTEIVFLVDFDGTLYEGNSFHSWVRYVLWAGLSSARFRSRWQCRRAVMFSSLLRTLGFIDHAAWKRRVQLAWHLALPQVWQQESETVAFIEVLKKRIDYGLLKQIRASRTPEPVRILTTAAPAEYVEALGCVLGFNKVIATPAGRSSDWIHNIGTKKFERTMDFMKKSGLAQHHLILYTDHLDDRPLMESANEIHLVAVEEGKKMAAMLEEISRCGAEVFLHCR